MKAIVCARGKGGGCRVINTDILASEGPRDLFGRTEAEIVRDIAQGERIYNISKTYTGNEGLAINLARKRACIEVDKLELAILRGEKKRDPATEIAPSALAKWRREFLAVGPQQGRRR